MLASREGLTSMRHGTALPPWVTQWVVGCAVELSMRRPGRRPPEDTASVLYRRTNLDYELMPYGFGDGMHAAPGAELFLRPREIFLCSRGTDRKRPRYFVE